MKSFYPKLIGILLLVPLNVFAQNTPTLQELIDSALVNDEVLQQQGLENKLTGLDDEKLKNAFLPRLDVSGKGGYLYASTHLVSPEITIPAIPNVYPGAVIPEGTYSNNLNISGLSATAKAEASMLIYSGGKVKNLREANREKGQSEKVLMEKSRDEIITAVSKAYDQFALVNESKRVLDEAQKRLDINQKTADKALGYGLITPYDHKKIELAQATLASKIVEYEGKRSLLITQLYLLTGIEKERISLIAPSLMPIQYKAVEENISDRAEIKALEHGIKATDYKIKAEKSWWIPKVQAQTSLTYFGLYNNHIATSKDIIPNSGKKLDWSPENINVFPLVQAGVGFKWDIFDGKEGKHAIAKARIDKQILESKKSDAEKKLKLNLANNQTNYDISLAQIALKQKAREIARNALEKVEKEFRYGTKKSADLIDAENDLETAELEYQNAIFLQRRSAIELMQSTQDLQIEKL